MSRPNLSPKFQQSLCWAALAVAAISAGTLVFAQSGGFVRADEPASGRIVPITPGGALDNATDNATPVAPPQVDLPKHWIGILLGPVSDEVRAQIAIPEDQGVLVRQVVPDSPAAKAGIQVFDIIVAANDKPVVNGRELTDLVQQEGDSGGKITLDILRRGEQQSITIVPAARPEPTAGGTSGAVAGPGWGLGGAMRGMPGPQFRMFAPGGAFSQSFNLSQMPDGVSVSIQKQNDEPAHITVKRGNDSWEIIGDDPKSLEQLPDDVRPFVERLLSDNASMTFQMPNMPSAPGMMGPGMMGPGMMGRRFGVFNDDEMQQQLRRMEEQLQQMRMMLQQDLAPLGQPSAPAQPMDQGDAGETEAN